MKNLSGATEFIVLKSGAGRRYADNLVKLFEQGATIPFIARYRKEMTGSMDEVEIGRIRDLYEEYGELEKRKETVIGSIAAQNKLTPELEEAVRKAVSMTEVEDIYLPYKPKRKTRASKAREAGLEPLALWLLKEMPGQPLRKAEEFINEGVETAEAALAGASDIIAEMINEDEKARRILRRIFDRTAIIRSRVVKGKEEEGAKFADYFDFGEPLKKIPSHRFLAIRRGVESGFIKCGLEINEAAAVETLSGNFVHAGVPASAVIAAAVGDAFKRLLFPSMENEYMNAAKHKADGEAIRIFASNLRQLLMAPPLGNKRIMGIDPGFRTGCKVVCLDETGNLLHNETVYPHPPHNAFKASASKISQLITAYRIDAIAVGNGTAGRETEAFISRLRFSGDVKVFVVSESGASVYSASEIAREEFPDYDVTVRGAVSIARRLMDPLSELVKIDPKSIGVGQYQHDVDQSELKTALDRVVESCVNNVGVNVNTASKYLLSYVSGLGPVIAGNIRDYIAENGGFRSRRELLKVKRMGEKTFEQCAGFLRIPESDNPLDNSAVHPESYGIVERMARDAGMEVGEFIGNEKAVSAVDLPKYVGPSAGIPTLTDILDELRKPGRDPRAMAEIFAFDENICSFEDVKEGMIVNGIVTNITDFGAFVDIGAHCDGLVHISEMADRFIKSPLEVVALHQHLRVKVIGADKVRRRISLSLRF